MTEDKMLVKVQAEIAEKIREIGQDYEGHDVLQTMNELYASLKVQSPRDNVKLTKDEKYGPHERHRLDVYEPENRSDSPVPILVFVHGGAFIRGDKSQNDNVGYYFARHNVLTIVISYRLAPQHKWPAGAEDIAGVLKWIAANGENFGGDTNRIFLMGHSAGTAHVSTYVFFEEFHLKEKDGVAGAILMSGPTYDIAHLNQMEKSYYGEDESKYPSMSVLNQIDGLRIPVFILFAEFDLPQFVHQSIALFNALYERDKESPQIKRIINHNHFSELRQINTVGDSIGPDILNFISSRAAISG